MLLGPDIDPPAKQHTYRPDGVYRSPDTRAGCAGRTLFEAWSGGVCIVFASIDDAYAGADTEAAFWSWYDLHTDPRMAVNALPPARRTPRHLRAL